MNIALTKSILVSSITLSLISACSPQTKNNDEQETSKAQTNNQQLEKIEITESQEIKIESMASDMVVEQQSASGPQAKAMLRRVAPGQAYHKPIMTSKTIPSKIMPTPIIAPIYTETPNTEK